MKAVTLALALLAALPVGAETQRWSGIDYYYKPEQIGSLDARIFSLESLRTGTHRPLGTLHFVHGETGYPPFADAGAWPIGDFTGLAGTEPADEKQTGPGKCSVFQVEAGKDLEAGSFGWVMKTECVPLSQDPAYRFANMQANVTWPVERMPRPWTTEGSRFGMEFSMKLPVAAVSAGAKAYATAQLAIHDGEGRFFWMQPTLLVAGFEPGAERKDMSGFDQDVPWINPVYRNRGRYLSKFDNPRTGQVSSVTATKPWSAWRWYAFTISRAQLLAAVEDLNAKGGKFSTDISRYGVGFIGVQTEINRQQGADGKPPQGTVGIGLKQLYAYRLY